MINKLQKLAISGAGVVAMAMSAASALAQGQPQGARQQAATTNDAVGSVTPGTGWAGNIGSLISSVLTIVMVIAILLVLLYLIMGGIEWITSGGDKGKTESARNKITSAIIGIIILAAAYALVQLVAYVLGFANLNEALGSLPRINK